MILVIVLHAWLVGLAMPNMDALPKRMLSFALAWLWCSAIYGWFNRGDSGIALSIATTLIANVPSAVLGLIAFTAIVAVRDRLRKRQPAGAAPGASSTNGPAE